MSVMKSYVRKIIKVGGIDAFDFLQNIITNDLRQSNIIYTLLLSPNGRFLHDFFVIQESENILIDVSECQFDILYNKLSQYKLRKKVILEKTDLYVKISDVESRYKDPRHEQIGWRKIQNEPSLNDFYIEQKYSLCIPDHIDMIYDKTLPPEMHLDKLNAISYTKGCYIGQELITRTKYRGEVRKSIFKIKFPSDINQEWKLLSHNDKWGIVLCDKNTEGLIKPDWI